MKRGLAIVLFLILVPIVSAQFFSGTPVDSPFGFFGFYDFGNLYDSFAVYIDSLIYMLIFLGIGKYVFKDKEKENPAFRSVYIGLALMLTIGLLLLESRMGFTLLEYVGPWTVLFLILLIGLTSYQTALVFTASKLVAGGIAALLTLFFVDNMNDYLQGQGPLGFLGTTFSNIKDLIYLLAIAAVIGGGFWLARKKKKEVESGETSSSGLELEREETSSGQSGGALGGLANAIKNIKRKRFAKKRATGDFDDEGRPIKDAEFEEVGEGAGMKPETENLPEVDWDKEHKDFSDALNIIISSFDSGFGDLKDEANRFRSLRAELLKEAKGAKISEEEFNGRLQDLLDKLEEVGERGSKFSIDSQGDLQDLFLRVKSYADMLKERLKNSEEKDLKSYFVKFTTLLKKIKDEEVRMTASKLVIDKELQSSPEETALLSAWPQPQVEEKGPFTKGWLEKEQEERKTGLFGAIKKMFAGAREKYEEPTEEKTGKVKKMFVGARKGYVEEKPLIRYEVKTTYEVFIGERETLNGLYDKTKKNITELEKRAGAALNQGNQAAWNLVSQNLEQIRNYILPRITKSLSNEKMLSSYLDKLEDTFEDMPMTTKILDAIEEIKTMLREIKRNPLTFREEDLKQLGPWPKKPEEPEEKPEIEKGIFGKAWDKLMAKEPLTLEKEDKEKIAIERITGEKTIMRKKPEEEPVVEQKELATGINKLTEMLQIIAKKRSFYEDANRQIFLYKLFIKQRPPKTIQLAEDTLNQLQDYLEKLDKYFARYLSRYPEGKYAVAIAQFQKAYNKDKMDFVNVQRYGVVGKQVRSTVDSLKDAVPSVGKIVEKRLKKPLDIGIEIKKQITSDPNMKLPLKQLLIENVDDIEARINAYYKVLSDFFNALHRLQKPAKELLKLRP